MKKNKNILVPTDFSDVCSGAIDYGVQLAGFLGYTVNILHVVDNKTLAQLKKENLKVDAIEKRLESIVTRIKKKSPVAVNWQWRKGSIFKTIASVADELEAAMVVLGTHGKVGLEQKLGGSYAKKVVTSCTMPVIVVQKGTQFRGFENIVFPVSSTAEVRQKVAWATLLTKTFKSKIHIFQLYESAEESQKKMKLIIGQITREFEKKNVDHVHIVAEKGKNFGQQVIDYTKKNKADLITIMTAPSSLNFIFNRYTEHMILNGARIPVMCVNPVDTWQEIWKF